MNHATQQASLNTQAMLDAATSTAPGALSVDSSMSVAMTSLSLFTFLLLTPQGWATMYLGLTGFVRAVEAGLTIPPANLYHAGGCWNRSNLQKQAGAQKTGE